jgi:hypothetical protein
LEAAKTILDRHLGRPAIQADISLHRAEADGHIASLLGTARRRALEPITLEDDQVEISSQQRRHQRAEHQQRRGGGQRSAASRLGISFAGRVSGFISAVVKSKNRPRVQHL